MLKRAFITVVRGQAAQSQYELDPSQPVRIGRGTGCQIYLSDPLSSRTHVVLSYEAGRWLASDADSRNGTMVNEHRITQVPLNDGDRIRIGSTELDFHWVDPSDSEMDSSPLNQTLVLEAPISAEASYISAMGQLYSRRRMQDLMDLFQLSLCLLRCSSPDEVLEFGIDILRVRTESTVAGILWLDDQGRLKPQKVVPPEGFTSIRLSRKLTDRVVQQAKAVWVKQEAPSPGKQDYADAMCIPLMRRQ